MPVTAKLSRRFYETFGDEIANELVEWFNQVDATYRFEFRDLFATNFARFDAKLEQRIAELRGELRSEFERRFAAFDAKLELKVAELRGEFEQRFTGLDAKLDGKVAELRAELGLLEGRMLARLGVIEGRFGTLEGRLLRWMFVFWVTNLAATVAMIQLLR